MKLLVMFAALVSILGSVLLYKHAPSNHSGPSVPPIGVASRPMPPITPVAPAPIKPPTAASPSSPSNNRDVVRIYGAADAIPIISEIATAFEATPDAPRLDVKATNIESAKQTLSAGTGFEFALVSRELTDDEKFFKSHPVAYRGVTLVVNANNPVNSLDDAQIKDLYLGTKTKWTEVGGGDAGVTLYQLIGSRNPSRAFYDYFKITPEKVTNPIAQSEDPREILRRVGADAGGIAFVPYITVASQEARDSNKIKLVAIHNVDPSAATIRDGSYPLGMPILLLTRGEPEDGPARNFLRFINSDAVQDNLRKALLLPGR